MSAPLEEAGALRRVTATRYVAPLREGGSLPGLVEADDLGTYVCNPNLLVWHGDRSPPGPAVCRRPTPSSRRG